MKMKHAVKALLVGAALGIASQAGAVGYVYVGSWNVADGPLWSGAPAVGINPSLSAVDVAAYLFGGSASDYAISTVDANVANINFSAWLDGYGDTSYLKPNGTPASQSFVGVVGSSYADGFGNYSAYVFDHACGIYYCDGGGGDISTNYAFRIVGGAVPEPASWALMIGGLGLVGGAMRRRSAAISFA